MNRVDHGLLLGTRDDDHPQYYNSARLNAWYATDPSNTHTHLEADVTDLGSYSVVGHTHVEADITDLGSYSVVGHSHVETDITDLGNYALSSVVSQLQNDVDAIEDRDAWHTPTLLNGWVNYGGSYEDARYRITWDGTVWLQGMIKSGTTTAGTQILSLPSGYRPNQHLILPCTTQLASYADCTMQSDGSLKAGTGWGSTWTFLNLSFPVSGVAT